MDLRTIASETGDAQLGEDLGRLASILASSVQASHRALSDMRKLQNEEVVDVLNLAEMGQSEVSISSFCLVLHSGNHI